MFRTSNICRYRGTYIPRCQKKLQAGWRRFPSMRIFGDQWETLIIPSGVYAHISHIF